MMLFSVFVACTSNKSDDDPSILIFSKTEGYRHTSIEHGREVITDIAAQLNYQVSSTEDAAIFTKDGLEDFTVIVFLNTTGDVLNDTQQEAFEEFIRAGGGFIGIHAAADTEYHWHWYGKMVGAYFNDHPNDPNVRQAIVMKQQPHQITAAVPETWERNDEWYNYKEVSPDIQVLLTLDEKSYEGGTMGGDHPITWFHEYDGGRVFYTGMGHTEETFDEPVFKGMIEGAIKYVAGEAVGSQTKD